MNTYNLVVSNRTRAESFGLTEHFTEIDLVDILNTYGHKCLKCGKSGDSAMLSVDHVIPLIRGGTNKKDNIQILCKSCNTGKYDKIEDYRGLPEPIMENKLAYAEHRTKRNSIRVNTRHETSHPVMLRLPEDVYNWLLSKAEKERRTINSQAAILFEKLKAEDEITDSVDVIAKS